MNGCDPKGACRSRQPTQGLRLAEPVNPGRVARAKRSLPVFVLGEDQSKTRPAGQRLDTHQRSGQSQGIAPTSPAQRRAKGRSPSALFPSPKSGASGLNQPQARTVQQDAAGVWGVPRFLIFPHDWGTKGVDAARTAGQMNAEGMRGRPFWTRQCYSTYN
jgi:hypothetical protein